MKYVLIKTTLIIFIYLNNVNAGTLLSEYNVTTSGFKIGKFTWEINIEEESYETKISLKNSGIFSPLYKFKGDYISSGIIKNKNFETKYYKQIWKTKKKTKVVEMYFDDFLLKLLQKPEEKEVSRVKFNELFGYYDPITSFINILNGNDFVKTIDGRRIYIMKRINLENSKNISLEIKNYKNIWADHKRNDLKKIDFIMGTHEFLPEKIIIYFKDRVFKLDKA